MFYPIVISCFLLAGPCMFTIEVPFIPYRSADKCKPAVQKMLEYTKHQIVLFEESGGEVDEDYVIGSKCVKEKDLPEEVIGDLQPRSPM